MIDTMKSQSKNFGGFDTIFMTRILILIRRTPNSVFALLHPHAANRFVKCHDSTQTPY